MPINRRMDKENVVYMYKGITCSHNKGIKLGHFSEMWMDLETAIQSGVSQNKKNTVY